MALNTQIKVGADSSGVATGLEPGKRALKDFGASADGAGKSLAGMGNGTAQSAQKIESATKSMIQSIQRTTAATEAGDKSTRAYQESLARMRGIDVAALKPYLDQLDAAKNKASNAAIANESFAASFAGIRNAALIAAAAVGSFAIAFKKINDGVDALNDLKDATGASIENISALEDVALRSGASFDTVSTSLIKFNGILKDAKPGSEAEQALKALGLSVADFKRLDPAEALRQTAVAMNSFADDGNKARIAQELFGKSLKDVAPFLKDLAEQGKLNAKVTTEQADEAEKFNKELFNMQKNITDVARDLAGPMVESINEVIKKFKEGREAGKGFFSVGWQNYKDGIGEFYGMKKSENGASGSWDNGATGSWGEAVKPSIGPLPDMAAAKAAAAEAKKALAEQNRELSEQAKLLAELSGLTGSFSEDWNRLSTIYKSGKLSLEGLTKAQADLLAKQPAIKAATDAESKSKEILAKANLAASESHLKYVTSIEAGVDKIKADIASQIEATERMGLTKEAVANLDAAKLEMLATDLDLQAIKALDRNLDEQTYNALKKQAQGYRDLAQAKQAGAARETVVNAAKEAADEWKRTADSIQNTLTDALMRGFESGKDFAKNMRDTIVNMFKTMVLRPVISAVMNPIAGAVTGALGLSGAAQAAGVANSGASAIGSVGTLASLATTAASWGTAAGAGFMATIGGSTIAGGGAAGILATGGAAGAGMAGMIGALGPYALAALAVLAIHNMTQGETRNGASYVTGADGKASFEKGPSGGEIQGTQVRGMFDAAKSSIEGMLAGFGSKAALTGFVAGLESSENGKGFAYAGGKINGKGFGESGGRDGGQFTMGDKTPEQAIKDYQLNLSQSILEALQVTEGLPSSVAAMITKGLNGSEVKDLSQGAIDAILGNVTKLSGEVNTFNAAMTQLPFESLKNLSFDTAAGLIAAAGGFEKLDANLGGFYANFYTAEEQRAQSITNTEAAFKALGLTMPALDEGARAAYRSMVELAAGQDLSIEANAKAYASLLALQGPMNQIAPAFTEAGSATATFSETLKNLQKTTAGLQIDLLTAQGKTSQAAAAIRIRDIDGYTAVEVAAYDYNTSLSAQISATNAAAQASQTAADAARAYGDAIQSVKDDTLNIIAEISNVGKSDFDKELDRIMRGGAQKQTELDRFATAQTIAQSALATANALVATAAAAAAAASIKLKDETEKAAKANTATTATATTLTTAVGGLGAAFGDAASAAAAAASTLVANAAAYAATITTNAAGAGNVTVGGATPGGSGVNTNPNSGIHMATGGQVFGPGTATSDSVPAMLSAGEFVVKASSVNKYGTDFLNAINSGTMGGTRRLAAGGSVSASDARLDTIAAVYNGMAAGTTSDQIIQAMTATGVSMADVAAALSRNTESAITQSNVANTIMEMGTQGAETAAQAMRAAGLYQYGILDTYSATVQGQIAQNTAAKSNRDGTTVGGGGSGGSGGGSGGSGSGVVADNTAAALLLFFKEQQQGLMKSYGVGPTAVESRKSLKDSGFDVAGLDQAGINKYFADLAKAADVTTVAGRKTIQDIANLSTSISALGAVAQERAGLENQLNGLHDTAAQALKRQRDALDESNRALFDTIQLEKALGAISQERKGLQDQLNALTDTAAQALTRQRDALDASNRTLFDSIQIEKAKEAATNARKRAEEAVANERKGLQDQLNGLTDTAAQALKRQRDALDASNRTLFDAIQLEKAKEVVANERKGLQDQLNALTDTNAQALTRQRDALDASNRALFDQIEALKLRAVNSGWKDQLDVLTGARTQTQVDREKALAEATSESTRALMRQVYAQQDLKTASEAAKEAAAKGASDAMSALQRAVDAQRKIAQVARDAAAESVSEITSIFDTLQSSVKELYGTVDSTARMQAEQGRAFIKQALATAQTTGYLPESKALTDAINAAKGGTAEYASQFEKDFAALTLAGDLSLMETLSKAQLTEAERMLKLADDQLKSLDGVLELAQKQLDAANGINTSVLSVADAVAKLAIALTAVKATTPVTTTPAITGGGGGGGGTGTTTPKSNSTFFTSPSSNWKRVDGSDTKFIDGNGVMRDSAGLTVSMESLVKGSDVSGSLAEVAAYARVNKLTSEDVAAAYRQLGYTNTDKDDILAWARNTGVPAFAVGTNYVPHDMLAQIHEGEAIVPRAYNPAAGGSMGGNTERLEALVEGLTKEVQRLQSIVTDGNKSNERIAVAVNGNPDRPMPIDVLENSAGLATA